MKTKVTSTLAALAALIIIAATPINAIADDIAVADDLCAVSITSIFSNVMEIESTAPRINKRIPTVIAKNEIANDIIEDINSNITGIDIDRDIAGIGIV